MQGKVTRLGNVKAKIFNWELDEVYLTVEISAQVLKREGFNEGDKVRITIEKIEEKDNG